MPFRATNIVPARGYEEAKSEAGRVRNVALQSALQFMAGGNADQIYDLLRTLAYHRDRLQAIAAIPGIGAYAQAQEADAGYNVAGEFTALIATINSTITWMQGAIPAAGGYDQMYQRTDGINLVPRTFSAAALAPLVTRLQSIAAAVV